MENDTITDVETNKNTIDTAAGSPAKFGNMLKGKSPLACNTVAFILMVINIFILIACFGGACYIFGVKAQFYYMLKYFDLIVTRNAVTFSSVMYAIVLIAIFGFYVTTLINLTAKNIHLIIRFSNMFDIKNDPMRYSNVFTSFIKSSFSSYKLILSFFIVCLSTASHVTAMMYVITMIIAGVCLCLSAYNVYTNVEGNLTLKLVGFLKSTVFIFISLTLILLTPEYITYAIDSVEVFINYSQATGFDLFNLAARLRYLFYAIAYITSAFTAVKIFSMQPVFSKSNESDIRHKYISMTILSCIMCAIGMLLGGLYVKENIFNILLSQLPLILLNVAGIVACAFSGEES